MAEPTTDVKQRVHEYIGRLRELIRLDRVYLFGSHAQGTADDWSDIDLAVISPDLGKSLLEDVRVLVAARSDATVGVSALPFSRRESEELPAGSFLREVIRKGQVVY